MFSSSFFAEVKGMSELSHNTSEVENIVNIRAGRDSDDSIKVDSSHNSSVVENFKKLIEQVADHSFHNGKSVEDSLLSNISGIATEQAQPKPFLRKVAEEKDLLSKKPFTYKESKEPTKSSFTGISSQNHISPTKVQPE